MKITVVGTGYVGLVTAALFSKLGHKVIGVDIDESKIKLLQKGKIPFWEPGLKDLVLAGIKNKRLCFTNKFSVSVPGSQVIFICVGTPPKRDGDYNLNYVYSCSQSIAKEIKDYTVVVIKSTVPPGTGDKITQIIKENTNIPFDIASVPEFLREGQAVWDSLHPSRIVIGTSSNKARNILIKLHKGINAPLVLTDILSAQLIKYAANAFLATKISFINSIAIICDKINADITKVSEGLGLDPRIGKSFLQAGLGYGGSCFPKDTWALISYSKRKGYDFGFLKQVDQINKDQINYFINKIKNKLNGEIQGKKLAIFGLAFKPDTDDLRESRSVALIESLKKEGAKINAIDPVAIPNAKKILSGVNFFDNPYMAVKGCYALVLATEWKQYQELDYKKIKKLMKQPIILDGRNFLDKKKLKKLGFAWEGIGVR